MSEVWTAERKALALASCKKWHGTRHQNRIAILGVGIDCAQFINEVLCDAGVIERTKFGGYNVTDGMFKQSWRIQIAMQEALHVEQAELTKVEFGDLAVFRNGSRSAHCGFCTGPGIFHALADHCVVESQFNLWRGEIEALFRITEIGLKNHPQQVI